MPTVASLTRPTAIDRSDSGAEAIVGAEVKQIPRIQPPTPSKLIFTEDGALYPDALPERKVPMSAQKVIRSFRRRRSFPLNIPLGTRPPNPLSITSRSS